MDTDPTFTLRMDPPQEPGTTYVCNLCSAIVLDTRRHTLAVHRDGIEVTADQRQTTATQRDPRQAQRLL